MSRPAIVGIIGYSALVGDARTGTEPTAHAVMMTTYVKAVRAAGLRPLVVPLIDVSDVDGLCDVVDAVLVTGGTDIDPAVYGQERDVGTWEPDHGRDLLEIAVVKAAVAADVALLAVCRGLQVLNVAFGGTLMQHLDHHRRMDFYNGDAHAVSIASDSRLRLIVGADSIQVNSLHHQAVDRVGSGLRVVARADDGTVEALEMEGARHAMGVQWHPELLRHRPEQVALFRALAGER